MQINQAQRADLEALVPLFDGYRQFYQQASDLEGARSFLRQRLENHESVILLASADGQAAGFTQLYPSFSSVQMRRAWILNDLFVSPAFRGSGVGKALLLAAQAWAQQTGATGLFLETAVDNPAQHLYELLGWRRDPHVLYYFWQNDHR